MLTLSSPPSPMSPIAALPPDEKGRLAELQLYQILDTAPELAFDRLTRLAARHFGMPIALVSLVDRDRQWFKSRHGLEAQETPRDLAFCAHTLNQDGVMVVRDATDDPRFAANPLVTGPSAIRFYAGAPLTTRNGHKLGTLCVIDRQPHPEFDDKLSRELAELASIVIDEMELRLSAQHARRDLDALKRTQQALEDARRESERMMQEKAQFVATISHELRTPMNGILGMAYLLADTLLNDMQRGYIDTINHSAQNLLLLINDVLDLSKIEAGELILERRSFDIKNGFVQTINLLKPLADKKRNSLRVTIDPAVPDMMIGDPLRFAQIVTNLVGNAIKFTEGGTVDAGLRFDAARNVIYCQIEDTGIGIPADKQETIFEKFTQGDAAITQKYGGTGLGLAITKQLVVMLGGKIGFQSEEKIGSCFWFTLPVALAGYGADEVAEKMAPADETRRVEARQAQVLIAEDHPVNQMFLVALLKKFGFAAIDTAENGREALAAMDRRRDAKLKPYDMLFMDCKMPELDGYETTRLIRAQERDLSAEPRLLIIAMTANAMAGDRETCFAAGMDEYLTKPLQPDLLKKVLTRWFSFPADAATAPLPVMDADAAPPMSFARLDMVAETAAEKAALVALFLRLAAEIVAEMEKSRRDAEQAQWKNAAHKLKGAAANMGMAALEHLCGRAEKDAPPSYDERSLLLRHIRDEIARIESYIATREPLLLSLTAVT